MKKATRFLLLAALALGCVMGKAQTFGVESPVMEKNILVGFKAGINALDMAYSKGSTQFVNPSVIYSAPLRMLSCVSGGIFVERSIPHFSYGLELNVNGLNATRANSANDSIVSYVTHDSSFFVNVRIPLKVKFWDSKSISPYLFVAPSIGTYLYGNFGSMVINGYSVWNGQAIHWGDNNTTKFQISVFAGVGLEGKININLYQIRVRFEAGYNYGITNMTPSNLGFNRSMRGWEATLGIAFPLLVNPSYGWMM